MRNLLLAALILAAFAGCKKDKESVDTVKVMFYTNAHLYVNCGGFDVRVYVDDKLCGILNNSRAPKEISIPCDEKDESGILAVEVEKNVEHTYIAVSECGISKVLKGGFCFSDDECHSVFLDFYEGMDFPE